MGNVLSGSTKVKQNVDLLTPEQRSLFSSILGAQGGAANQALGQFLQPKGFEDYKQLFEEQYVQPAQQAFQRSVAPAIQQRFVDLDAGASSALNQALAQSASDISTGLGSQFGGFLQGQQQNQLQALAQVLQLLQNQNQTPLIQQQQGLAGPLLQAGGSVLGGALMSSEKVKENVSDYDKGLEELAQLEVKKYDYIEEVGGEKNKIGVIAEKLPKEITVMKDNILHVDLYGLVGLLINAVKDLNKKVELLEGK